MRRRSRGLSCASVTVAATALLRERGHLLRGSRRWRSALGRPAARRQRRLLRPTRGDGRRWRSEEPPRSFRGPRPLEAVGVRARLHRGLTLFTAWFAVSMVWTEAPTQTPLEVERAARLRRGGRGGEGDRPARPRPLPPRRGARRHDPHLLLRPLDPAVPGPLHRAGVRRPSADRPIGYWNALGLVAAMGTLLALSVRRPRRHQPDRALAAATIPLLLATLYFTYSRGATLALARRPARARRSVSTRRLQLLAASVPIALVGAFAVYRASRSAPLTHTHVAEAAQVQSGHHLALVLVACAVAAAYAAFATAGSSGGSPCRPASRGSPAAATTAVAVLVLVARPCRRRRPAKVVHKAYNSISSNPPSVKTNGNLNNRLFSLSSNGRLALWHVAVHTWERSPLIGLGPGSYEQEWLAHRHDHLEGVRRPQPLPRDARRGRDRRPRAPRWRR